MKKNIVIVILLLALIGVGAYIGYDKFYVEKQEENKTEPKKEDKTESKAEELSINSTFVEELVGRYDYYFIQDTNLENMLYKSEKTTPADFTEDFIKQTAVSAYYSIPRGLSTTWQQTYSFTSDELKKQVRKLYGPNTTVTDSSFEMDCGTYNFDVANNTYTREEGSGCGGTSASYLARKIIEAKKEENKISIKVAVARVDMEKNQILNMNKEAISGLTTENFNINNTTEQLDQFTYNFNYDKENSNYYLDSITKTK